MSPWVSFFSTLASLTVQVSPNPETVTYLQDSGVAFAERRRLVDRD